MSDAESSERDGEDFSLYFTEERVLSDAEAMISHLEQVAQGVQALASAYRRSYSEQRRLIRLSDRMQEELQAAKQRLAEQTSDLLQLNQQLTTEAEKRVQLTEELLRMASTDLLTGAYTRRHLYDRGAYEIAQSQRRGEPLSALLLDLDRFKQINDLLGHQTGDEALRRFAEFCRAVIRKTDTFARYGGEEFVILLPNTELGLAFEIAERIRTTAADNPIESAAGPLPVTVSCGIASYQADDGTLDSLLARADHALYEAKRAGRNRVVVDPSPVADDSAHRKCASQNCEPIVLAADAAA